MKGAREYKGLFKSRERIGDLLIKTSSHARGFCLKVFVVSQDQEVEVYGIVDGQPGWTEEYGWIHKGPWIADFERLVSDRRIEKQKTEAKINIVQKAMIEARKEKEALILEGYRTNSEYGINHEKPVPEER